MLQKCIDGFHIKPELCAFARKGEHNVYSLVPNIVCMYIYILIPSLAMTTMCIFSIFCEHRQLKHGIHVIDPSREVSSHCMTVQVGTSGYKWLQVVTSGYNWLQLVTSGFMWVKSGFMWLSCFMWLCGFMWLNGCMWLSGFMWLCG